MHLSLLDPLALISAAGYIGLFAIVFAESGLFFGFFLPGDSLLFTAGLLASQNILYLPLLLALVPIAAILGDSVGYLFGKWVGPRLFTREDSVFFSKHHVLRAEQFYEKYGPRAIILARFIPVVRTFVPIVAGVAQMRYVTFLIYNIIGGLLWGAGVILLGYFLGAAFPATEKYLTWIIGGIILFSFLPLIVEWLAYRRARSRNSLK
ncbi:MAG: VTT domain-containing protein [Patescibacteria group bacterium]